MDVVLGQSSVGFRGRRRAGTCLLRLPHYRVPGAASHRGSRARAPGVDRRRAAPLMPIVALRQFSATLPEISSADGTTGFLVRKHWTRWIAYALFAPPILLIGIGIFADVLPWI